MSHNRKLTTVSTFKPLINYCTYLTQHNCSTFFLGETPGNFDCIIINESLDKAYNAFKEFVLKSFENIEN